MSRPSRIAFEGALYHITSRGNYRRAIFRRVRDRWRFLDFFGEVVERFGWICYAYCLMRNHFHLLIETPYANLSQGMRLLNGRYSRYFGHVNRKVGHSFQGRFFSTLVEKETYLRELSRYIVLNPVRAGICARAEDYSWSSYRATIGLDPRPAFLDATKLLDLFDESSIRAISIYKDFVAAGIESRPWDHLKENQYLGSEAFIEQMKNLNSSKSRIGSAFEGAIKTDHEMVGI